MEKVREELRDKFGKDSIRVYTESKKTPTIPTGILSLDKALGGGIALGRMTELYGNPSSGKSTVSLSICAQAQKQFPDKYVVYVDVEHALDTVWAEKLGINWSRFEHAQPELAEDSIFMMQFYLKSGKCSVIVLDSVAALAPKSEMESNIGEANIGIQARLVASAMRRLNSSLKNFPETSLIFINQKRARLQGGPSSFSFESSKTTGGKALPFYMTTRMNVIYIGKAQLPNGDVIGQDVKIEIPKHKVNTGPWGKAQFRIDNKLGIDTAQELLSLAIDSGKIIKSASWYAFADTDEKIQGEEKVKEIIRNKYMDEWIKNGIS